MSDIGNYFSYFNYLFNEESGDFLAVSEAFTLLASDGQVVTVTVEE